VTSSSNDNVQIDPAFHVMQCLLALLLFAVLLLCTSFIRFGSMANSSILGPYWLPFSILNLLLYFPTLFASFIGTAFFRAFSKHGLIFQLACVLVLLGMAHVLPVRQSDWHGMFTMDKIMVGCIFIAIGINRKFHFIGNWMKRSP
jgi:hypothetical protein